jgi:hypothetical protein
MSSAVDLGRTPTILRLTTHMSHCYTDEDCLVQEQLHNRESSLYKGAIHGAVQEVSYSLLR